MLNEVHQMPSECRKWRVENQQFSGGACPRTPPPIARGASGACDAFGIIFEPPFLHVWLRA